MLDDDDEEYEESEEEGEINSDDEYDSEEEEKRRKAAQKKRKQQMAKRIAEVERSLTGTEASHARLARVMAPSAAPALSGAQAPSSPWAPESCTSKGSSCVVDFTPCASASLGSTRRTCGSHVAPHRRGRIRHT